MEQMNEDFRALEQINAPLTLYKDDKADIAVQEKQMEEDLSKLKKVVYPFWFIALCINSALLVGYYY